VPNSEVKHRIVLFKMSGCHGSNAVQRESRTNDRIILECVRIAGETLFSIL